jgi:hypothetical protein
MKSCPECNRTFPDEGQKFCTFDGGLLIAPQTFDPNMTIRQTTGEIAPPASEKPTSRDLPDPNATIADSSFASTIALPRNTGPTGPQTTNDFGQVYNPSSAHPTSALGQEQTVALGQVPQPHMTPPQPPPAAPPPPPAPSAPAVTTAPTPAAVAPVPVKKKSKLPLIIAGILVFLFLGGGALAAIFFVVVKPRLREMKAKETQAQNQPVVETNTNTNTNAATQPSPAAPTPEVDNYVPPLGTTVFENAKERLDGKLAEHYFDFSFYYPESWQKDPKAGAPGSSSFVRVERRLPPDFTQENFTVGWYTSSGTYDGDLPNYPSRVEELSNSLSKVYPEYRKVSEGPTTVNSMKAYEFRWTGFSKNTDKGDLKLWGRVIFLPTNKEGDTTGATLLMLSTSLAPELLSVDDLGVKGEGPVILDSFRFGKKK